MCRLEQSGACSSQPMLMVLQKNYFCVNSYDFNLHSKKHGGRIKGCHVIFLGHSLV